MCTQGNKILNTPLTRCASHITTIKSQSYRDGDASSRRRGRANRTTSRGYFPAIQTLRPSVVIGATARCASRGCRFAGRVFFTVLFYLFFTIVLLAFVVSWFSGDRIDAVWTDELRAGVLFVLSAYCVDRKTSTCSWIPLLNISTRSHRRL